MTPHIDNPKQGVSQADVYQLMAYGRLYNCSNVMLLYPHHADLPNAPIHQTYSIATMDSDEKLIVATLNLDGTRVDHQRFLLERINSCLQIETS